jgi:predicted transcriptional regulator of viral defense system
MKTFKLVGASSKAVDNIIESLRRKGWLERASWGKYLLIPAEQGREGPSAIAIFWRRPVSSPNLIILATAPHYIGYGTAAAHYGLTTQHRNMIFLERQRLA